MNNKVLYQFTLDKEVEEVKETVRKNKKTGEETVTKKTVKVKKPIEVQIARPTRRQIEEAEFEYSIEISKCVKNGILTKAMLAKKYSDTGGLFSEYDSDKYAEIYKNVFDLQNEYMRLDSVTQRTELQEERYEEVKTEIAKSKRALVEFESNFQSLFDHTADVKAQNKVLLWYATNLTQIYDEKLDKFVPYFEGDDFKEKTESYYQKEEQDDPFYLQLIKKVSTVLALWFFHSASTQEEFDGLVEKMEKGDL